MSSRPRRRNWNTTPKQRQTSVNRFLKGAGTAVNIASKALAVARGVAAIVNTEYKWLDTIAVATAVNTTPAINSLTAVAQGVTENQRVGESIKASSLALRMYVKWNGTTEDTKTSQRCRAILVRDLQQGAVTTAPTIGNILANTANAQQLMQSFINKDQGKRWNILFDKILTEDQSRGGVNIDYYYKFARNTKQIDKVSRKCDPHIRFHSAGATDYEFGHVWLILIGDLASGSSTCTCEYMSRLNYIDN